jgi:hypothetical protein
MAVLNSKFDILRGWPDGSAVAEDFTKGVTSAATDVLTGVYRHGQFVALGHQGDGTVGAAYGAGGKHAENKAIAGRSLGLIIEGDEETSSAMSNTVTCLVGGGYMVRLHLEGQFSQNAYGNASIPNARDQYVLVRPAEGDNANGVGLAKGTANFENQEGGGAAVTLAAGMAITVIDGVACAKVAATAAEISIGTCLKVGDDFIEILVH